MMTVSPNMQALLTNPDGLTPVIDVGIPLSNGVYGELTTLAQMQGVNEVGSNVLIFPAIILFHVRIPAVYKWQVVGDVNLDATRISGRLTLAAGAAHAMAAAPTVYGTTSSAVYNVDVLHTWVYAGVVNAAVNAVGTAITQVTTTINNFGNAIANVFGW